MRVEEKLHHQNWIKGPRKNVLERKTIGKKKAQKKKTRRDRIASLRKRIWGTAQKNEGYLAIASRGGKTEQKTLR